MASPAHSLVDRAFTTQAAVVVVDKVAMVALTAAMLHKLLGSGGGAALESRG